MSSFPAALDVKRRHEATLLQFPDVVGVGVGQRGDACCLMVYLSREEWAYPKMLDGVPVRYVVSGPITAAEKP